MNDDFHFCRSDVATRWRQIASCVESDPLTLKVALENIRRWLSRGRLHPAPLIEWRRRIHEAQAGGEGMKQFLDFLRRDNADAEPIKSCSPFVGIGQAARPS